MALCLDLSLRQHGVRNHSVTLDDVMRGLWKRCHAGPMQEADVLAVLQELTGRSWARELKAWVHGTRDLPLESLLTAHGVAIHRDPAQLAQRLGLRVSEEHGVHIKQVLNASAAHAAGFAPGDEWLGLELSGKSASGWRLKKLDDVQLYAGAAKKITALVSRDQRLLRLSLTLPSAKDVFTWRLGVDVPTKVKAWLA